MDLIRSVNRCQVAELEKAGKELDPQAFDTCAIFTSHVQRVEAAVVHTYQLIAFAAIQLSDPKEAAMLWKDMMSFCELAIRALKDLKDRYSHCGTHQLYDRALDYRAEAERRYLQNLQDSECANPQEMKMLFPKEK